MYFMMILVFVALLALCWFGFMGTTRQAGIHAPNRERAATPPAPAPGATTERSTSVEPAKPGPGKPASPAPDNA